MVPESCARGSKPIDGPGKAESLALSAHHLVTHGVVVGMTGSGKTGLLMVTVEEALRSGVPVLAIDVKGDLPNLLLAYPSFAPEPLVPWVSGVMSRSQQRPAEEVARALAVERQQTLTAWGIGEPAGDGLERHPLGRCLQQPSACGPH